MIATVSSICDRLAVFISWQRSMGDRRRPAPSVSNSSQTKQVRAPSWKFKCKIFEYNAVQLNWIQGHRNTTTMAYQVDESRVVSERNPSATPIYGRLLLLKRQLRKWKCLDNIWESDSALKIYEKMRVPRLIIWERNSDSELNFGSRHSQYKYKFKFWFMAAC